MINHKKKIIFIHIPKTAGVSIYKLIGGRNEQNHKSIKDFRENYFSFCIVRNPWDRVVSCYHYFKQGGRKYPQDLFAMNVVNRYKDFSDFIFSLDEIMQIFSEYDNKGGNGNYIIGYPHLLPQTNWTHDGSIRIIDFIARFENLIEDLEKIKRILKVRRINLPHKNKSIRGDYRGYYNNITKDIIYKTYKKEIDIFGYDF